MGNVTSTSIASALNLKHYGDKLTICGVCSLGYIQPGGMYFAEHFHEETVERINNFENSVAIVSQEYSGKIKTTHTVSQNPRYAFAKMFSVFFPPTDTQAVIGDGSVVEKGAVIKNAVIGRNCIIKANAVIGSKGFSFAKDDHGRPFAMPHKGRVIIGDNCEIGACTTIVRGVIEDTVLGDYVKLDDHVHVAHNCRIGDNTLITACAEISGSVLIGRDVWIAPNVSVSGHIVIDDEAYICIGTAVGKDIEKGQRVIGKTCKIIK